jgi:hypothetical protein
VFQFRIASLFVVAAVAAVAWVLTCGAWRLEEEVDRVAPLDPRDYARLTVITVGTGDRHENPARRGPATAIGLGERVVLVDAGRGLADALRLAGIPTQQPDTVYLTSLLPENVIGLDDFLLVGWINGRTAPLRVVGPPGSSPACTRSSPACSDQPPEISTTSKFGAADRIPIPPARASNPGR